MVEVVKGEGVLNPDMILIGEAPGEEEIAQGRPFVGPSGRIQDAIISSAGLIRERCWIDNVVPIRPPLNKIEKLHELGVTIADFIPNLTSTLKGLDCKVVVAYGETALNVLTGYEGISKHRGSIYPCLLDPSKLVVPTFHPRFIIENWKMKGVVVEDVKKAIRIKKEGRREYQFNTLIKPTLMEVESYVREISNLSKWSFDIEVVGSGQIACVGIGGDRSDGSGRISICIPFKYGYHNYWGFSDELFVWQLIQDLFKTEGLKIGQNINYDLTKLLPFIGEPSPPWCDLMVAYHLIEPELPHTLAFMTSIYTDINYYKDDPKDEDLTWKFTTSSERLWDYNGKDVAVNLILEPLLMRDLTEMKMLSFFQGYSMPLMRAMWRMQQRGMMVDEEIRGKLLAEQIEKMEEKKKELREAVGYDLNPLSHKQMIKFLYTDLKLPLHHQRKTHKPTADKETLEKLYAKYPRPEFKLAMDVRDTIKDIGTYLMAEADDDGRMRSRYNICGTTTGRPSSRKTYEDKGIDAQNIPEELRGMFVAGEGKVLISFDLWQAEVYVVAILSNCQSFLLKLKNGEKIHRMVASWIFNKPEEEIDNVNRPGGEYFTGKRTTHAADYGLGPNLFSILIKRPVKEAKEIMAKFHAHAPEIGQWHREVQEELQRTRVLITPFGRKRTFRERLGDDLFRKAYAHVPQSTIADYCLQAQTKLEYWLPEGAEIVQNGFDSLLIEAREDQVDEIKRVVEMAFDKTLFWKGVTFKIPIEFAGMGRHWKK